MRPRTLNRLERGHVVTMFPGKPCAAEISRHVSTVQWASFFFGVRIMLGTILGRFSIIYFRGLGLRITVRVWVRARVWVRVWVSVSVMVRVRVSVVLWSG